MKTVMHQPGTLPGHDADLRDPEFYEPGLVAEVTCDYGRTVQIKREGYSLLIEDETGEEIRSASDFRNAWGFSGTIPETGWELHNNGWFALYTECGRPIGDRDNLAFDLPEAIEEAQTWLIDTGRQMLATAVRGTA